MKPILHVQDLSFAYKMEDGRQVDVLKSLTFDIFPGEFVAIQGPSGSGKSTLFYLLGFLLRPTGGNIELDGIPISQLSDDDLTLLRNQRIGFIFQQFHLLAKTSVLANILLPTQYPSELKIFDPADGVRAKELADQLGLHQHYGHFPNQLSGGQQQRVAIARALINDVDLILADEPTGNLDSKTANHIIELLLELNRQGKTIILITHDDEIAKRCSRVYHVKDGAIVATTSPVSPGPLTPAQTPPLTSKVFRSFPRPYTLDLYKRTVRAVLHLVKENLLRNKTKSLLTMLGVVIGVAAVFAMVTLGEFTKHRILQTYEALGVNKLQIRGYPNWNLKATDVFAVEFRELDWERDLKPLRRIFPQITLMSPVLSQWQNTVAAGGITVTDKVSTIGVNREYLAISNLSMQLGHEFNSYQVANRSPVCIIGSDIATRLFAHVNPIGQMASVSDSQSASFPCRVVGVLRPVSTTADFGSPNTLVLLPFTYFQTVVTNYFQGRIHEVALQLRSGEEIELTGKKIKNLFEQRYGASGHFSVDSDSTLISQMKRFLNLFTVLLGSISILSLAVGGIGINNMMLVSVTDRLKEFGIRKAFGATNQSIRVQVLLESTVLCLAAGAIGALTGFVAYEGLIFGATKFIPNLKFEWILDPVALILSVLSILIVGIASGFVPAMRAERLQIIEALRAE